MANKVYKVIDVSVHQGIINWDLVKPQIDAAIIRCGYGDNYTSQDDAQFARNLSECERLGIPRGVYLYSYAKSDAQARSELEHVLRLIKGHTFQLPIYLDCEEAGTENYAATACKIICEGIKAAGFTPGVYSSTYWWNTYLTSVTQYRRWVAHWASACGYSGSYDIWQYGTTNINGINGVVDSNYCYTEFSEMVKTSSANKSNTTTKKTSTTTTTKETSKLKIVQNYLVNNPCYQIGAKITVKGLMLHSVGCAQPSGPTWCNIYATNSGACVHAFIDANDGIVYQTLPWNHRGWHGGGSSNDTHIGVEMCESAYITYTGYGATFTVNDKSKAIADAKRAYNSAVELFAYLCKQYNLNPLASGVIVSHSEGYRRGIATNHADPEHYWNQLGLSYTMDGFRKDVQTKLNGSTITTTTESVKTTSNTTTTNKTTTTSTQKNNTFPKTPFTVTVLVPDLNIRKSASMSGAVVGKTGKGVFTITQVSGDWGKLKSSGYWIYIKSPEYCKIGKTIDTTTKTNTSNKTTTSSYKVRVTSDVLNIRKGAGRNYGIVGTISDKGIYTIVETKGTWGKLKSGAGWISLNYTKKV